jgi:hypothetical protein
MPKKRFSAFEDFPVEPGATPPEQPRKPNSLFEKPAGEVHVLHQPSAPQVERIERLPPSQMIPDRFQPRRLLPTELRRPFFSGQIDCYQAARQWLQMARGDPAIKEEVDRLLAMGGSFEEHGQIKPITGAWVETGDGGYLFQIETGERRFWAACLQYASARVKEEPLLRVEVVPNPTRSRQVLENRHAEAPSAVGRACEVAALILAELDVLPDPARQDEFAYFRQAIGRRMPAGLWDKIIPIMQVSRVQLEHLLNILHLPDPLLDLADRHRLPERVLREVLRAPEEEWEPLLRAAIKQKLTAGQVAGLTTDGEEEQGPAGRAALKGQRGPAGAPDPALQSLNAMRRFTNAMDKLDEASQAAVLDELADEFIVNGRAQDLTDRLGELVRLIQVRQQNRYRRH